MSKAITAALVAAATSTVAATIRDVAISGAVVRADAATNLASGAIEKAVAMPSVQDAIASVRAEPIAWYRSQALWGGLLALAPSLVIFAGQRLGFEITDGEAAEIVSQVTAIAGAILALHGRVTTTRPIAGTAAAAKVLET
ncbi:hypothetical protein ACFQI3_14010 [Hansschlegelia quercus]|uniref:Holin n=1 Tax=Hansschlegelia quercus TaxID=2528245 RepID=A0A4Q9GEA8_9HYPH|nr:hypothetical protein [Hansschlegelia quercus]TBN48683.1 hypothetical protein EYR15_13940 [Hansschlegelia quercus]